MRNSAGWRSLPLTTIRKRTTLKLSIGLGLIALLCGLCQITEGGVLTLNLNGEFSGAAPPAGSDPWLTATFDDSFGGANTVRLTMAAPNLVATEFVHEWLFNFDPALDPTQLSFAPVDTPGATPTAILTGVDAFKADGDGFFDILFDFPPPPSGFDAKFTAGETVTYDITYIAAIGAQSFDFDSAGGGGRGPFPTAAHVQGIGPEGNESGWVTAVPEPSSIVVWGLSLLAGAGFARLRRRKSSSA